MKTARLRSLVLYIILAGFFVGIIFFIGCFFVQGGDWAMRQANAHLDGTSQLSDAGTITDRDDNVIAYSEDGERHYSSDYNTRLGLLHVLGDTNGYISTGVQSTSLTKLTGYNTIMGLNWNKGGSDMQLTVSASLSSLAYQQLAGRNGAVAVYNYKTGEVLCMVSTPSFDPEDVPDDIEDNSDYDGVFLNKALSSTFTPGSIFKVVTTACALENMKDVDDWTYNCEGSVTINGNTIVCDSNTAHGTETLQDALTNSCNCAYAELADELGASKLNATAKEMGFNVSFTIDDNSTAKSHFSVKKSDSKDALAWAGIGQYTDTANPAHMMIMMGAIANGGTPVMPYTIKSGNGYTASAKTGEKMLDEDVASKLNEMMRNNVINGYGDSLFPDMNVCAKTGTAESDDEDKADTGWIVGYSQNSDTPYAFAVVVEEGGYGLSSAGAIASALMTSLA